MHAPEASGAADVGVSWLVLDLRLPPTMAHLWAKQGRQECMQFLQDMGRHHPFSIHIGSHRFYHQVARPLGAPRSLYFDVF